MPSETRRYRRKRQALTTIGDIIKVMFEKAAITLYRYYNEVKYFALASVLIIIGANAYGNYMLTTENDFNGALLFINVYGHAIIWALCLCIFYFCFIYLWHPELNGLAHNNRTKANIIRAIATIAALANAFLIYLLLRGHH